MRDPADPASEMGPLISAGQRDSVRGYLDDVQMAFTGSEFGPDAPDAFTEEKNVFIATDN